MQLKIVGVSKPHMLSYHAHCHPEWELIYNAYGSGSMIVGGEEYTFSDDTVLLCPPGMYHSKQTNMGFTDYFVRFSGCELPNRAYVLRDSYDRRLLQLIRVLHSTFYDGSAPSACANLLEAILSLIKPMLVGEKISPYVQMLRQRIAEGYTDPDFSLGAAMDAVPLNTDHLRRLFVRQLGQTPHQYLTSLRLDKAKLLLSEENSSISEVAYRCGFYDSLYFSKVFRKATGVSPTKWR